MKRVLASSLVLAVALGCHEPRSVTSPKSPGPAAAILDGAHGGGNTNFFFLPPLVALPTFTGVFNPNLGPLVQICTLTAGACDPTLPVITPGPMSLDATGEHYQVDWNTQATAVSISNTYRIEVFTASALLGFADVQPVSTGSALKNLETGDIVGLVDGRTLPIKVRIETGALCFGFTLCTEQTVVPSTSPQDVVLSPTTAAIEFPGGYFSQTTTVLIAQVADAQCFSPSTPPPPFAAFGCYDFATSPFAGDPLACTAHAGDPTNSTDATTCARLEVCPDLLVSDAEFHVLRLLKSDPGVPATVLKEAPALLITSCPAFGLYGVGPGRHRILDLASMRWRGVVRTLGRLVLPTPLFGANRMTHLGVGGLSGGISNIGWAPLALTGVRLVGGTTLTIGGAGVAAPSTIVNRSDLTLLGVSLQAFVVQGTVSQSAGTTAVFCSDFSGNLAPGTCGSSVGFAVPGGGTFVPGLATARFELHQGATLLDVVTFSVTLTSGL